MPKVDNMEQKPKNRWRFGAFAALAAVVILFICGNFNSNAVGGFELAQDGSGRYMVVPIQIGREADGIVMVDTVGKTLWVYQISTRGAAHSRLRLLAARNWEYDQLLPEYNTGEPRPEQVKEILDKLSEQSVMKRELGPEAELEEQIEP